MNLMRLPQGDVRLLDSEPAQQLLNSTELARVAYVAGDDTPRVLPMLFHWTGEELVFAREGVQSGVLRKLRRGQYRVQAEIDLHGLTVPEAKEELRTFLAHALERHIRCVRVVHGKGLRSGHRGPVLKGAVSSVLRRVGPVLAYVSARQVDGGTGALYVLLATWPVNPTRR